VGVVLLKKKGNIILIALFVTFVAILATSLKIDYVPKDSQSDLGNDLSENHGIFQIGK
jgi:hypothetical protein